MQQSAQGSHDADRVPAGQVPPAEPPDGARLWEVIREANQLIRETTDPDAQVDLARRRARAWEELTILSVDLDDPPWFSAACACAADVAARAAERIDVRRRPRRPKLPL